MGFLACGSSSNTHYVEYVVLPERETWQMWKKLFEEVSPLRRSMRH